MSQPQFQPPPHLQGRGTLVGIAFKLASVAAMLAMVTMLKLTPGVPTGEMVFFRSFFALVPILVFLAVRGELRSGWRTERPGGHLVRGLVGVSAQGLAFYALTQLPLAEATAINYTQPLLSTIAGVFILRETVRLYRWSAIVLGLVGVGIIIWPRLTVVSGVTMDGTNPSLGALCALGGCCFGAIAFVQVRRLVRTESSATIVLYFSLTCALLALFSAPFGWVIPSPGEAALLVGAGIMGGIGQVLLTEGFRHADISVVAPFEYSSLVFSIVVGYALFGDVPTLTMIAGSLILVGSGVFIIVRERRLGIERARERQVTTPQG